MSEQFSPLARRESSTRSKDVNRRHDPVQTPVGPDPLVLTISAILLFVLGTLVVVFRTLYPVSP